MYVCAAQYNHPLDYPVTIVCGGINGAPSNASILQKIFPGLVAYGGISSCYFNEPKNISKTTVGWNWQVKWYIYFSFITNHNIIDKERITMEQYAHLVLSIYYLN